MGFGQQASRWQLALLALGALAGLLLAGSGLVTCGPLQSRQLPANAVARVDQTIITRERYAQVLQDLASDSREPIDGLDREFVINRMIDEELLIQRGVELGMVESSAEIRKALAASVIAQITAETTAQPPSESDLRQLYASDPEFFRSSARYHVRWKRIDGTGAHQPDSRLWH